MNHSLPKTTFASDAFFKTMLGKEVKMTINNLGKAYYTILQHDMYHVIAEDEHGDRFLIAKSAIIAVVCPDTSIPELNTAIVEGVTAIDYKASQKRLEANKHKANKKYVPRPHHAEQPTAREVPIVVKPKRKYQP